MSQLNDISLVAQVVVFKNTKAFDQLVKEYQSPIRRFFLNLTCGDSELSDDLAQDTFIKAYTNIASFRNLSSFSTWLYRIAYNVFYDYIRSRKETADLDTREIDAINSTEQENIGQKMDVYLSCLLYTSQALNIDLQKDNATLQVESELAQLYREAKTLHASMEEYSKTFQSQQDLALLKQALTGGQISMIEYFVEVSVIYQSHQNYLQLENQYQKAMARIYKSKL